MEMDACLTSIDILSDRFNLLIISQLMYTEWQFSMLQKAIPFSQLYDSEQQTYPLSTASIPSATVERFIFLM
jgi:hypothetical protein